MEDPPVYHGYLLTPPQGKLLKRTWQRKYYALYRASNYAVERVEVFDNEEGYQQLATSKRIIPLNDCVKVVQLPQKNQQNVFEVRTKKQVYQFSSETTQELAEWVTAFQKVAFGGRRDLGSPIALASPGVSTPVFSSPSPSLLIKAEEEENQIYSSCNWAEPHHIQVVDTDASTACGLRGNYILVVSPLHLLLYEDGANEGSQEPLFVWPYRHIRRYGRSKDAFTFEAGRKCSTGEGIFTFATVEANVIFLRVQTNTRALKHEREDAVSFSPGLLHSKPHFSSLPSPQIDVDHRSFKSGDHSLTDNVLHRKISQESINRLKLIPPKPPRKTKLSSGSDDKLSSPTEPIRLEISNAARAKLAAEALMTSSTRHLTPILTSSSEPTYAVPEFRKDAWKTFGLESDNIHSEKVPDAPDLYSKVYYASSTVSPTNATAAQFPLPIKDQVNRILPPHKKAPDNNDDYCYDHLSQFGILQSTKAAEPLPEGHIYSRLLSVSSQPELPAQTPDQDYEEVLVPDGLGVDKSPSMLTVEADLAEREDIKHFLQNDHVYTVVSKKPVKESTIQSQTDVI